MKPILNFITVGLVSFSTSAAFAQPQSSSQLVSASSKFQKSISAMRAKHIEQFKRAHGLQSFGRRKDKNLFTDLPKLEPIRTAFVKASISKHWTEKDVQGKNIEREEVICVKEGPFQVYDARAIDDGAYTTLWNPNDGVKCGTEFNGIAYRATLEGDLTLINFKLPEVSPNTSPKIDFKVASPIFWVDATSPSAPGSKRVQTQTLLYGFQGTRNLNETSYFGGATPIDAITCVYDSTPANEGDCRQTYPVWFSAFYEITDAQ